MVKDCKELLDTIPNPDSHQYPAKLLSLQGKRKIFQLHFDPECTKNEQVFILDTCWDETPLLISDAPTLPESSVDSSKHETDATIETDPITATTANTPEKTITAKFETPDTFQPKETDTTPPPKETPLYETPEATAKTTTTPPPTHTVLSETPKPRKEQPKRNTRRELFTEDKDTPEKPSLKKSKKTD